MVINQYDIVWANFDPSIGHEIKKTRPCVVLSPNELNHNIATVIVAPLTTKSGHYPTRIPLSIKGKTSWMVLDQIRTLDQRRIIEPIGKLNKHKINAVKAVLKALLVD